MEAVVTNKGKPPSKTFAATQKVAGRMAPVAAAAFVSIIQRVQDEVDVDHLAHAITAGRAADIERAAGLGILAVVLAQDPKLERALFRTSAAAGKVSAEIVSGATGLEFGFAAVDPNVVMFARDHSSLLIRQIEKEARSAVQLVIAVGAEQGVPTVQQARVIREIVGLPSNWALAPSRLRQNILDGNTAAAVNRRLSASDKAQIRSRIARGTNSEAFADEMAAKYAASLTNRRARNIARTETLRAANFGVREGWRQGIAEGVLPKSARRNYIVTPDDVLRETHAAVPGMNPGGVEIGKPFLTPLGPKMDPPIEALCRCGQGLTFPGFRGVL